MTESTRPPRPGHPPVDIAWRLRNWVWYWTLKRISGLSDERLDAVYVPEGREGGRKRFFQRLRSLGSDPTVGRVDLGGGSVFQQVHATDQTPELRAAEEDFRSQLWKMLSQPRLGIEDHRQFIDQVIAKRGWYRLRAEDRSIVAAFLQPDPTFGHPEGRDRVYSAMLTYLEAHPTAEHVALLAALFREAMTEVALTEAMWLRSSLLACVQNWIKLLRIPAPHLSLLVTLIMQRLVHGWWFTPDLSLKTYGTQRRYVQALVEAHLAMQTTGMTESQARHPIVTRSPRVAWIDAHRAVLEPMAKKLHSPIPISNPEMREQRGTLPEVAQAFVDRMSNGEKARQAYADWVSNRVKPPPPDLRYCLPVEPGSQGGPFMHFVGDRDRANDRSLPYLSDGYIDTQEGRKQRLASKPAWTLGDPPPPLHAERNDDDS